MTTKAMVIIGISVLLISAGLIYFGIRDDIEPEENREVKSPQIMDETPDNEQLSSEDSINQTVQESVSLSKDEPSDEPIYDPIRYSWSTMNEGPYHDRISYATSTDLLNWRDSGKIIAQHASVPDVLYRDGKLYVYFVDVTTDGYAERIGVLISADAGKTWGEREFVSIKGIGQKAGVDPSPYLLDDGRIRLFYFDIAEARKPESKGRLIKNKIYSAISDDGINFIEEEGIRLEHEGIYDPTVIKISENLWRMYVGNQDGQKVFSAISTDGLEFKYEGIAFTGGAIPDVIFEYGKYYLFTGGVNIATSEDGITFKGTGKRFDSGKLTADPGVVKIGENNFFMVYKTKEPPRR
jgi:hypothetical protein